MDKLILNALRLEKVGAKAEGEGIIPVEGYVCHFNKANHNGEIVDEASFASFFSELEKGGLMPVFNYQHTDRIIGGWDNFESRANGLYGKGHLNTNVAEVRDNILPLVEAGDIGYLSTEGWCDWDKMEERKNGVYLKDFIMTAVSLVALPADFGAKMKLKNELAEHLKKQVPPKYRNLYY